jgi:hypothetical protein
MVREAATTTARWLAEALETGNPLAPLPAELTPRNARQGERIASLVLDAIGQAACGVRVAPGPSGRPVTGPVLEPRLLHDGATIALAALRHAGATAAVVGVLGEDLPRRGDEPPVFAALHPAIDVGASRFRDPPGSVALLAADLGGLGLIVVGRAAAPPAGPVPVALGPAGARQQRRGGVPVDVLAALAPAAAAARRLGGLPAGALLVAAGLTAPSLVPEPGATLSAGFGLLGRVRAAFA